MAQYTKQQLISASNATYFTNVYGGISASAVRDLNDSWVSSSALLSGSNTFIGNQIISGTMTAQLPANYIWLGDSNGYNQAVATSSISLQGAQGIQGLQGTIGSQGVQGITGAQGITGSQGIQGTQGLTGAQGLQGITGTQGIQGITGASGSQGIQGIQGIQGADNSTQGATGAQGIQGIQGADNSTQGAQGTQGTNGTQGVQGFTGAQGIQGITGITGSNGTQGAQGIQGVQGTQGDNVSSGSLLVTASFASTNITFTKGDATTFDLPGFATTGSNTFNGNQTINGTDADALTVNGYINGKNISGTAYTYLQLAATNPSGIGSGISLDANGSDNFILDNGTFRKGITFRNSDLSENIFAVSTGSASPFEFFRNLIVSGNVNIQSTLTASLQQGYAWVGDSNNRTTLVATSSFGTSINTGSFATTGSNTFIGEQIISGAMFVFDSGSGQRAEIMNGTVSRFPQLNVTTLIPGLILDDNGNNITIRTDAGGATNGGRFIVNPVSGSQFTGSVAVQGNIDITGQYLINGVPISGGANINTGSFATTGSNTFYGSQTISGSVLPLNNFGGNLGGSGQNWTNLYVNEIQGLSNLRVDTIKFNGVTLPLASSQPRQLFGNGIDADTAMYYATSSANVNALRELAYVQSGSATTPDMNILSASFASTISGIVTGTGFATTGSNTFRGQQTIDSPSNYSGTGLTIVSSSINFQGVGGRINFPNGGYFLGNPGDTMAFTTDGVGQQFEVGNSASTSSQNLNFLNRTTGQIQFQNLSGSIQFTAASGIQITGSNLSMQGFAYPTTDGTSGQVLTTNGSKTLSFTTVAGGATYINPTLNPYSGSLILVANTFTSSSFAHISASANGQVNLIFKNNNNTGTTTISGSNNIFTNATAPTTGFKRFIGGSGNLMLSPGAVNQISASQTFPITTNFNIHTGGAISTRAAVSASAWTISNNMLIASILVGSSTANAEKLLGTLNITSNQVGNQLVIQANKTAISASTSINSNALLGGLTTLVMASSSIGYFTNVGNATITNGFQNAGGSSGNNVLSVSQNWFGAATINVSGSDAGGLTNPRSIVNNYLFGGYQTTATETIANLSLNGSGSSLVSTMAMGHELGITGSNGLDTNIGGLTPGIGAGSAFFGRWNAQDGNRARTAETIFAVGTGTSTSLTKTGFLIDSGSNSYFEGTLNVSGSTAMNGNQYITGSLLVSSFTTLASVSSSLNFADDTAAAAGGVPLGGLYRNGNFVMIRLT